jgi:hypothetical protein
MCRGIPAVQFGFEYFVDVLVDDPRGIADFEHLGFLELISKVFHRGNRLYGLFMMPLVDERPLAVEFGESLPQDVIAQVRGSTSSPSRSSQNNCCFLS